MPKSRPRLKFGDPLTSGCQVQLAGDGGNLLGVEKWMQCAYITQKWHNHIEDFRGNTLPKNQSVAPQHHLHAYVTSKLIPCFLPVWVGTSLAERPEVAERLWEPWSGGRGSKPGDLPLPTGDWHPYTHCKSAGGAGQSSGNYFNFFKKIWFNQVWQLT